MYGVCGFLLSFFAWEILVVPLLFLKGFVRVLGVRVGCLFLVGWVLGCTWLGFVVGYECLWVWSLWVFFWLVAVMGGVRVVRVGWLWVAVFWGYYVHPKLSGLL